MPTPPSVVLWCPRARARSNIVAVTVALALAALVGACGDGGTSDDGIGAPTAPETEREQGPPNAPDDQGAEVTTDTQGVQVTGELGSKPQITLPGGEPPAELVVVDLQEGDGPAAPAGATVTTHYVGVSWLNDTQFDASWDRGDPATFPLDAVIPGWSQGIPGMKAGGRRLLIIPPGLGYGAQSPTPEIAPNDTLVFVIDLEATG